MEESKMDTITNSQNHSECVSRFNLLHEPWIQVIELKSGQGTEVSLLELFEHAQSYRCLAGEMETQNFAVLRILLAILHTVFSRFNAQGEPYEVLELDELMCPQFELEYEDDQDEYEELLMETWAELWESGKFPQIVQDYLLTWEERFFLLDDSFPFMQVRFENIDGNEKRIINHKKQFKPTIIYGRNINRLISESSNKVALFSPKYSYKDNKNKITLAQLARWLPTLQGFTSTTDKAKFTTVAGADKYIARDYGGISYGWTYTLGGLYVSGNSLYETLLLNLVLVHPQTEYRYKMQKPCWEYASDEMIERCFQTSNPDNLAELYTNWSRAIYIDPMINMDEAFEMQVVKLPALDPRNYFLEPMTMWTFIKTGAQKGNMLPQKHEKHKKLWRSFGLIAPETFSTQSDRHQKPGIMSWMNTINNVLGNMNINIHMISLEDDGNKSSRAPVDEVYDALRINELILTDLQNNGWIPRILDVIDETVHVIERIFGSFVKDLQTIRGLTNKGDSYINHEKEVMYYIIDDPFQDWLGKLTLANSKDERVFAWRKQLKCLVSQHVDRIVEEAGPRDYEGVIVNGRSMNIATSYNLFRYQLKRKLGSDQVTDYKS